MLASSFPRLRRWQEPLGKKDEPESGNLCGLIGQLPGRTKALFLAAALVQFYQSGFQEFENPSGGPQRLFQKFQ